MGYKKVDGKDIDHLISICTVDRVILRDNISEDYAHDELSGKRCYPEIIVKPTITSEVSQIMKYAYVMCIPVTPRGQGTGLVGASVALYGGIMMDMSLMNKIVELDEDNLTLTVEPGVLLMEISEFVENHDFFYPPDPGEKSATIAGNINTNAGGMRAVKYGVTRDYVRGLEIVLANGDIMNVGGKIVKNSSGYSLKDLIVGSEGTLGIVTKAILKLLPLPSKKVSLLVPFGSLEDAIDTVPKIIKSKIIPTAIEYMTRDVILCAEEFLGKTFPDKNSDAYLLLTFDGNSKEDIEKTYAVVADICIANGAKDVLISDTNEREESIWSARGAFLEAIKSSTTEMDECDVVVPRVCIAEFVKYTQSLQSEFNVRIKSFGHAGDGNLHIYVLRDDLDEIKWKQKLAQVFSKMYSKAVQLNGKVSGEHGIGYAKLPYFISAVGETQMGILRGIKDAFDVKNILNPGKVC